MKKKLFTLLLCVFAVLGANAAAVVSGPGSDGYYVIESTGTQGPFNLKNKDAAYIANATKLRLIGNGTFSGDDLTQIASALNNNLLELDLSDASIATNVTLAGKMKNGLTTLVLPDNDRCTTIPEDFAVDCTTLTDLTLGSHIKTIGRQAFKGCKSLDVDFSTATSLESIGENAFLQTGITNIELPSSVKFIEQGAFCECQSLETLTIPANSELIYIKSMTFRNLNELTDVYVNVDVHTNTDPTTSTDYPYIPYCELNAFDFESLVDQTDVLGHKQAMLHFPDGDDNFNFYCGKGGMVLNQSNLNDVKDYSENGWRQFARTGSSREIPVIGGMFCTYSTNTPYLLPDGIKVYRATSFAGAKTGGTITLTEITYSSNGTQKSGGIPVGTGVILKGSYEVPNEGTVSKFYLDTPKDGDIFTEYPYETADANYMNYLVGTFGGGAYIEAADWANGKVTYRNFGFKVTKNADGSPTDDAVFMRTKKGNMPAQKAYLKLPASISEMLAEVNDGPGYETAAASSSAKVTLVFEDADFTQTTSLQNVDEIVKNADNNYYTLEGVKVNTPTVKGIYVRNGKKIVVK